MIQRMTYRRGLVHRLSHPLHRIRPVQGAEDGAVYCRTCHVLRRPRRGNI